MAKIIYCHPRQTKYGYHIFTDLDFWDARRILKDVAEVRRNFGHDPSGDEFPTQIIVPEITPAKRQVIERRLAKAIVSPPRHLIVRAIVFDKVFEFDPSRYYPSHWSRSQMLRFTYHRLPLEQSSLNSPYKTVRLSWAENKIRVEQVQRTEKYDPVIRSRKDALRRINVPSCF